MQELINSVMVSSSLLPAFDGVVREVNARVLGRGLKLVDGNNNKWELNQLLFADDTVVVAD